MTLAVGLSASASGHADLGRAELVRATLILSLSLLFSLIETTSPALRRYDGTSSFLAVCYNGRGQRAVLLRLWS